MPGGAVFALTQKFGSSLFSVGKEGNQGRNLEIRKTGKETEGVE